MAASTKREMSAKHQHEQEKVTDRADKLLCVRSGAGISPEPPWRPVAGDSFGGVLRIGGVGPSSISVSLSALSRCVSRWSSEGL
eukprot:504850-Prymnesium_polylepis.1